MRNSMHLTPFSFMAIVRRTADELLDAASKASADMGEARGDSDQDSDDPPVRPLHLDPYLLRASCSGLMPRTVNFISGPSRTADIAGTLVTGAHGPRRLCVVLVGA